MNIVKRKTNLLKNLCLTTLCILSLQGCNDKDLDKLELVSVKTDEILVVNYDKDGLIALGRHRNYFLTGNRTIFINGKRMTLKPGIAVDNLQTRLVRFDRREFVLLNKEAFPILLTDKELLNVF